MTLTLIRHAAPAPSAEWNHSCTPQCPPDCDAAKNITDPSLAPTAEAA